MKPPSLFATRQDRYEGFWLHRRLTALGIRVVVIDPESLLVDRRAKRAKTDHIDARGMVRALMAWSRGEPQVLSEVRVPTVEQDDVRRGLHERQRLVKERTAHGNRIKGLLKTQGIMDFDPRATDAVARLDALVTGDGRPLGPCLKREIARELERLVMVMQQIAQMEAERDAAVRNCDLQADPTAELARDSAMIAMLSQLKGIGMNDATILTLEAFWRDFRNRREIGGWSGLAPARWVSGSVSRDQGITKAGPPTLRAHMIQMIWPGSSGSLKATWHDGIASVPKGLQDGCDGSWWFALARKLLIALWRYATTGMVPRGAIMT